MPAPYVSNGSNFSYGTVNQSTKKQTITYRWYVSSSTPGGYRIEAYYGWGYSSSPSPSTYWDHDFSPTTMWVYPSITNADCDDNVYVRHRGREADGVGGYYDAYKNGGPYQTWAADPTVGSCTPANAAKTTIDVTGMSWIPATKDTAVDLIIQYKETSSGTWLDWGTQAQSNQTGYSTLYPSNKTITGLTPDTSYDFRLKVDRAGTANPTTLYYGASATLSTLPDVPEVTTDAASNVTAGVAGVSDDGTATLNATIDRNAKTDLEWRFAYGTAPATYTDYTTWTASTSEPESVSEGITDLTESDTYYFRVEVRWDSGVETDEGSELNFTVPADPLAAAAEEDHMLHYQFTRKYGVACDDSGQRKIRFALPDESSTSSDVFITDASPFATGDVKISKDGGALANTTNLPTQITASLPLYELELTATEMEADDVVVVVKDTAPVAFRDVLITIETELLLGNADIDAASGTKTDTSAFKLSGYGAGHGIEAVAGSTGMDIKGILGQHILASGAVTSGSGTSATLTDGFDATNDIYNGDIIFFYQGTGAGQSRVINDFTSGGVVTLSTALISALDATTKYIIIPGARALEIAQAEITSVPTDASTISEKIQFVVQRFANRIKQTATAQTWYESDGTTEFATRAVSDDGSTQDLAKLQDP